jgi:CHAT domain-containing protein/tetratricopeptide (TPR) repeat protein
MPNVDSGHLSDPEVMSLAEGGLVDAILRKHVDECEARRGKISQWKQSLALFSGLRSSPSTDASAECPPMETLLNPNEEVLAHAATCDFCGPLLREFSIAAGQGTGSEKWRRGLARQQAGRTKPARLAWIGIAACLLVSASAGLWWMYQRNWGTEALLARAFTASRPFEYRLPDAGYAAQDARRGAGGSSFDKPTELLRAEEQIRRRLAARADDAQALLLKGLAELEERDYEGSIESLTHASDITQPDTRALVALGCAYLLRGDVEKRSIDYGHALDLLLKAVQQSAQDRAALFNLAIAYEKLSLPDEAADTWNKLLKLPADGWTAEARTRLENVEKLRRARQKTEAAVMQDPAAFLAHRGNGFRAERYLEVFWMKWLPQASVNVDAHGASELLATELERQNGDASVRDAVAAVRPGKASQALAQLGEVMAGIRTGKPDAVWPLALSSLPVLEANGQFTAAARLRAEMVYMDALQRRLPDCLRDANLDLARIRAMTYPSITAQLHLDGGGCAGVTAGLAAARTEYAIAERDLAAHGLWRQHLRAMAFLAAMDAFSGNHEGAWQTSVAGLESFWKTDAGLFQAENLQVDLGTSAAALGWNHAAASLYATATRFAGLAGSPSMEATCRMDLSRLLEKIGDTAGEMREVDAAEHLFHSLPAGPDTTYRLTFSGLRRAEAAIDVGRTAAGLSALDAIAAKPGALPAMYQAELEQARGLAYLAQSNFAAAGPRFQRAIAAWETAHQPAPPETYAGLAQVQLIGGDASTALATWQASRPDFKVGGSSAGRGHPPLIAFTILPRGIVVFSKNDSVCHSRMVSATVPEVERMCRRFVRLCSSPESNQRELRGVARQIYQWMLAPELDRLAPGTHVQLQADGWTAAIPFAALTSRPYVFEQVEGRNPVSHENQPWGPDTPAVLISVPSARAPGGIRLPILSGARGEAEDVQSSLTHAALLTDDLATPDALRAALPHAAIFHFAGHGWSDAGNGALVLAPDASGEARFLTSREIAGQNWSGCRLAVLSACLTAAGEQRGPINNQSLVRALLTAGAQQVLAAKWSISSEATRALMKEFYAQLTHGVSPPEALSRAEQALARQERWSHPYYWAAFEVFSP